MNLLFLVPPSTSSSNVARDLLYGCWCRGKRIGGITFPPISLLTVATVLQKAGHKVVLLDAAATGLSLSKVKRKVEKFDLVVVLTSTASIEEDAFILSELKKVNKKLKTVVFGGHPTVMPKETLAKKGIDIIILREAEFVLKDLASAFEKGHWQKVKGIGFIKKGRAVINDFYPLIENLDSLPIPDRKLLPQDVDYFNPVVKKIPYTTVFTSRGCPGKCTFCSSPVFYGQRFRLQSPARVLAELVEIKKQGYKEVFFRDENWTASKKRVEEICQKMIKEKLNLSWICSSRIDNVDRKLLYLMKKARCHLVRFGVESGSQRVLTKIKKGTKISQIRKVFRDCHQVGLETHAHFMIGLPGEKEADIKRTIDFAIEIEPTLATFGICTPYPGTPLFDEISRVFPQIADGSKADLSRLHTSAFYNRVFCPVSEKKLANSLKSAYRCFYFRPKLWLTWLKKMRNIDEFRRAALAATYVFDFSLRGDEKKN